MERPKVSALATNKSEGLTSARGPQKCVARNPSLAAPDCARLFRFESDFESSLRRFPMALRYKLDLCGVRLGLADWQRFPHETRRSLFCAPVATEGDRDDFVGALQSAARAFCKLDELEQMPPEATPLWQQISEVPPSVQSQIKIACPELKLELGEWIHCTELERYSLVKLSRVGHSNRGFCALLQEILGT